MKKKSEAFASTFISALAILLAVVITFSVVMTARTFIETAKQNNQVVVNPQVQPNTDNDSVITDDSSASDIGGDDESTDITDNTII